MSGSIKSRITQSAPRSRITRTPSLPNPFDTTSKPSNSSASVNPRTMSGSSSTMSTRLFMFTLGMARLYERNVDDERGAAPDLAVDGDGTPVRLGDVFDERQPDAAAAHVG